jgi:hypothetical protein
MSTVLTARTFFEELAPRALKGRGGAPRVVSFVITGPDGGAWTLRSGHEGSSIEAGEDRAATVRLTSDARAFEQLLLGTLEAKAAFQSGAIRIEGDLSQLGALAFLFRVPARPWETAR